MKSFDEWDKWDLGWKGRKAYEAGQQSKQSEIDELRNRINVAMDELEYPTVTWEETVFSVIKILKGNTNED